MGGYDFFEGLQQLSTRQIHITIENYLSELKYTQKNKNSNDNILLGATRIAYMLGLIDKTTARYYHSDSYYKGLLGMEEQVFYRNYWKEHDIITPLPIKEAKSLSPTKAKEMIETYIRSLLNVMGKIHTSENFYYVIGGITEIAVFLKLFDYKEMAKYSAEAYVKDGTNFRHY